MNKTELRELSQRLRRQLTQKFIFFYLLYLAAGAVIVILAYLYYQSRIWYGYETFYQLVHLAERFWAFLLPVYAGGGALALGCYYLKKSCGYLDELVTASENLFLEKEQETPLSEELRPLVVYLAHDLKTPLTSVIGYLTLLNDEEEISPRLRKKYLSVSLDKAERLEDLINEFFEITRFSLTHLTLELRKINLSRMLEQTVFEFGPMLAEKKLECRLDMPPDVFYECDPDKLQRVFDNLLRNAVSYSQPGGEINLCLRRQEERLRLTVQNFGVTIPEDKLERIFDQFFRLDSARATRSGGAGLGLAIAKEIVELHGGTISAESSDGQVTFTVVL